MTKMKIMAALLSMSLGMTSFAAVPFTASAETDPTLAASLPHEEITASQKKQMLEKYIKDNSLDAALYTLAVDNGVFTYITYYENDTETAEKIKTFMKENDISENSIIPKLRKGEKPVGGMITDYETIIGKLKECISENDLPAYVIVWFGNKSYNYTAKQDLKIPFDEVQQVMVMYLWRDEIVPKTIDAMLEKENIDPSLVLYDAMANASPTDTKTQVTNLVPDITTTTTVIENNEDVVKECTAKVKFAFLDYFSGISIDGLDITVSKDGTEIFSFNTSDTPEIIKDFSYSASMNTSAAYTLEIKGLPEKYGYENNSIRKGIFLNAGHDGKIYDETTMIARQEYGSTDPIYPEDPTFGFYKKVFNFNVEDEKKIPFSNTNNIKVTATVDTPKAEIIETNEKYIVLKADEPCSGTLTVTDESGRTITAAFEIKSSQSIVTGRTTAPITRTTTTTTKTTTSTITHTEPLKGDANCDGGMNMADAVLIMQSIANPEKFGINGNDDNHITEQGMKNADITGDNDGVTNADALEIQKLLLNIS